MPSSGHQNSLKQINPLSGWKWQRRVKEIASPFPRCPVSRECSWQKSQVSPYQPSGITLGYGRYLEKIFPSHHVSLFYAMENILKRYSQVKIFVANAPRFLMCLTISWILRIIGSLTFESYAKFQRKHPCWILLLAGRKIIQKWLCHRYSSGDLNGCFLEFLG